MSDPQNFYDELPVRNVAANFLSPNCNIGQLARLDEIGEFKIQALLIFIVTDLVLFFEVGKSMGASQVKQTVHLILEDFKHLKPEDFKLCFNRAKKGHYGKLYDRLDGQIILGWLMNYDNERDGEIEAIRAKENRLLKSEPTEFQKLLSETNPDKAGKPDVFKENIAKLRESLEANKKAREAQKVTLAQAERPKDPIYEMHQRWINRFDKIHANKPSKCSIRFIKAYGRMMDISTYLEYKQLQYSRIVEMIKARQNAL